MTTTAGPPAPARQHITVHAALASAPPGGGPPNLVIVLDDGTVNQAIILNRGEARTLAFQLRLLLDRSRLATPGAPSS